MAWEPELKTEKLIKNLRFYKEIKPQFSPIRGYFLSSDLIVGYA